MHWLLPCILVLLGIALLLLFLPKRDVVPDFLFSAEESEISVNSDEEQAPEIVEEPDTPSCAHIGEQAKEKDKSKGEVVCCRVLEALFCRPFDRVRPSFLKNPETKRNLELDCYNEEIGLAVEYNGYQHYHWPNFTGQTREAFEQQLRRDRYKKTMCEKKGITFIAVPYTVEFDRIGSYIWRRLPSHLQQKALEEQ
jgi:hypothetical protein